MMTLVDESGMLNPRLLANYLNWLSQKKKLP